MFGSILIAHSFLTSWGCYLSKLHIIVYQSLFPALFWSYGWKKVLQGSFAGIIIILLQKMGFSFDNSNSSAFIQCHGIAIKCVALMS
jgi:hypothetical protein